MPNIKSAKKRVKVIETKTMQNKVEKTILKTAMKKYEAALAAGDKAAATEAFQAVEKKLIRQQRTESFPRTRLQERQAATRSNSTISVLEQPKRFNNCRNAPRFGFLFRSIDKAS